MSAAPTLLAAGLLLGGCTPHIGDHCQLNTDCSIDGTRVCDNSQPNGYCTSFNCVANSCLDNAVCVMVNASVPGCPYNDYQAPSRTHTTLCLKNCGQDSDCRTGEGYVCRDPELAPYNGKIIDDSPTSNKVCVALPYYDAGGPNMSMQPDATPPVCMPYLPEAGAAEGGADAGDAGAADSSEEAAPDAEPDVAGGG
ncbi:MAG TPA: hypothetical protein VF765_16055 [Polyangiaceae bacterium]